MQESPEEIRRRILDRFTRVAEDPLSENALTVGPSIAVRLGYNPLEVAALPAEATAAFAGVGNPVRLVAPRSGEVVLDVGCGSGMDVLLVAQRVGPGGRVLGVDATPAMLVRAARAVQAWRAAQTGPLGRSGAEAGEVRFLSGDATELPVPDASVDAVISNGVFNLCLDKPAMLREAFRVLRPGGRVAMADILLEDHVTPEEVTRKGAWSD
jgi:SAM-dependent methyltransferase